MIENKLLQIICCPSCKSDLNLQENSLFCINCGTQYTIIDGIPILSTNHVNHEHFKKQKEYFNNLFKHCHKYILSEWQKTYIKRISNFFGFYKSNLTEKELVIDIGIGGSGYTVIEFAKLGIPSVGCDLSLEGLLKAKSFSETQNVSNNTFWVVCSAEELPFKKNIFKYFCCNAVLEHLPDEKQAVDEIGRITKNFANGYVTVPLKFKHLWPFLIPVNYYHDLKMGHLRRYDQQALEQLFEHINFKIQRVYYTGHLIKALGSIVSYIIKTDNFDKAIEAIDSKKQTFRYGASNIGVSLIREH